MSISQKTDVRGQVSETRLRSPVPSDP
jgi:hypothetical protein